MQAGTGEPSSSWFLEEVLTGSSTRASYSARPWELSKPPFRLISSSMAAAIWPLYKASLPSLPIRSRVSARSRWTTLAPGGGGYPSGMKTRAASPYRTRFGMFLAICRHVVGVCLEPFPGVVDRWL